MLCTGIWTIEFGEIAPDGGLATSFSALGRTRVGTFAFNASDDQTQDIFVEEQDDPVFQTVTTKGTLDISWMMVDWDTDVLVELFGGMVTNGQWQAPDKTPTVEKSVRVTPQDGNPYTFPRVKVSGKFDYDSTGKIFQIGVNCRKLTPEKTGTPSIMWG